MTPQYFLQIPTIFHRILLFKLLQQAINLFQSQKLMEKVDVLLEDFKKDYATNHSGYL